MLGSFFDEANAMGRAQALNLNSQLEEAGVLPPVNQAGGVEQAGAKPPDTAAASSIAAASAQASDSETNADLGAPTSSSRSKKQKKGKKGKKGKARK